MFKAIRYLLSAVMGAILLLFSTAVPVNAEINQLPDLPAVLTRLQNNFSALQSLESDFVQEKNLIAFKNKIFLHGKIYLQKSPKKFAWFVNDPVKYLIVFTDNDLQQWDEQTNRIENIPVSQNPLYKRLAEQIFGWAGGQYTALQNDYDINIIKNTPLVLEFCPKGAKNIVKSVQIAFLQDEKYVSWIKIQETGGDYTCINFKNTVLNNTIDQQIFKIKSR